MGTVQVGKAIASCRFTPQCKQSVSLTIPYHSLKYCMYHRYKFIYFAFIHMETPFVESSASTSNFGLQALPVQIIWLSLTWTVSIISWYHTIPRTCLASQVAVRYRSQYRSKGLEYICVLLLRNPIRLGCGSYKPQDTRKSNATILLAS